MATANPVVNVTSLVPIRASGQGIFRTWSRGARELVALVSNEIVYATMDTLRLMAYLRYLLHLDRRARAAPPVPEWEHLVRDPERVPEPSFLAAERL